MSQTLPLVTLEGATVAIDGQKVVGPVNFELRRGDVCQVHGPANSGKSLLFELLLGRHRLSQGRRQYPAFVENFPDARLGIPPRFAFCLVSPSEQRRIAIEQATFYQARWHNLWTESLTVDEYLLPARVMGLRPYEVLTDLPLRRDFDAEREHCLVETELFVHRTQSIGQLSNGELRKLLLIAAHLASPAVMLLDDPLGGIDPNARERVGNAIRRWCREGQTLVFCSTHAEELVQIATNHLHLTGRPSAGAADLPPAAAPALDSAANTPSDSSDAAPATPILSCKGLRVTAGACLLLDGIDWQVLRGEHWMITGPNGAGKSTLLALLTGDHPQAYSNDIELFGGRLGRSVTLWERRRSVGFVAPELGWHYPAGWSLLNVVLSGFDSSVGTFRDPTLDERERALCWLERFGLSARQHTRLAGLAEGERRLGLLARAMVHQPRLLLLDEPTQDLSTSERQVLFKHLDRLARSEATTVVLVTHHVTELPRCMTHHLALERGRVVRAEPL